MNLVEKSKRLMLESTKKNKSPAWLLTELAVSKGRELAEKHGLNEELVVSSLYLAHIVFDPEWKGEIQKNHTRLSAEKATTFLNEWSVPEEDQKVILNSIAAHHDHVPTESLTAEVVKNAECFKFVTLKGALIFLDELGKRGETFEDAAEKVIDKMHQKKKLLTLEDCKKEAEKNCKEILALFDSD